MQDAEELAAGPRRLGRRARLVLAGGTTLLVGVLVLTGSQGSACGPSGSAPGATPPARPWLAADDPIVRDLHLGVLDRARTPGDAAPEDVLPPDVGRTAARVGDTGGVTVYLADGPGFACLGVDGRRAGYGVARQCLLDVSIANRGLYVSISPESGSGAPANPAMVSDDGAILVIAVPDRATVLTAASTQRLADHPGAVVLRPGQDEVLLQQPGQPPVSINEPASETSSTPTC